MRSAPTSPRAQPVHLPFQSLAVVPPAPSQLVETQPSGEDEQGDDPSGATRQLPVSQLIAQFNQERVAQTSGHCAGADQTLAGGGEEGNVAKNRPPDQPMVRSTWNALEEFFDDAGMGELDRFLNEGPGDDVNQPAAPSEQIANATAPSAGTFFRRSCGCCRPASARSVIAWAS